MTNSILIKDKNLWNIQSLYELQYFNCPACIFKNTSKQIFVNHAYQIHPEAIENLINIKDGSMNDVICPWDFKEEIKIEDEYYYMDDNYVDLQDDDTYNPEINNDFDQDDKKSIVEHVVFETKPNPEVVLNKLEPYHCADCDKYFVTNGKLQAHMRKFHDDDDDENVISDPDFEMSDNDDVEDQPLAKRRKSKPNNKNNSSSSTNPEDLVTWRLNHSDTYCEICHIHVQTQDGLRRHYNKKHPDKKRPKFFCKLPKLPGCKNKRFSSTLALESHYKSEHSLESIPDIPSAIKEQIQSSIPCSICGKVFIDKRSLRTHKRKIHKIKSVKYTTPYSCQICQQKFTENQTRQFLQHTLDCNRNIPISFFCHKCPQEEDNDNVKPIKNINEMIKHVEMYHSTEISSHSESVKCDHCDSEFSCRRILDAHYYFNHAIVPYTCYLCNHVVKSFEGYKTHQKTVHLEKPKTPYKRIRKCTECDWKGQLYKKHWDEAHPDVPLPFLCHMCDYRTVDDVNLKQHIEKVHAEVKKFHCDQCNFAVSIIYLKYLVVQIFDYDYFFHNKKYFYF